MPVNYVRIESSCLGEIVHISWHTTCHPTRGTFLQSASRIVFALTSPKWNESGGHEFKYLAPIGAHEFH